MLTVKEPPLTVAVSEESSTFTSSVDVHTRHSEEQHIQTYLHTEDTLRIYKMQKGFQMAMR